MDSIKLTLDQIYWSGFNTAINERLSYNLKPATNPYPVGSIAWATYKLGMSDGYISKDNERKLINRR